MALLGAAQVVDADGDIRHDQKLVDLIVSTQGQEVNRIFYRSRICNELEKDAGIEINSTGPSARQVPLQFVTMQRGVKWIGR